MRLDLAEDYILSRLNDELSPDLTYHNAVHTFDVYNAARQIGQQEGLSDVQLQWLLTAALFHDAGFLVNAKAHEVSSCTIAQEVLPGFGYTDADIAMVCRLIMATEIPQRPRQHLEEIICDADLDYLGRDDFFDRSQLLYQEMRHLGTVASRDEYSKIQIAFLDNHQYFTATSKRLRDSKKEENYNKLLT
ncbi:HD domain-containing protein [Parapedobacter koreensis]|uniref:HD domain-containing protein n=1 Tax=Parapedobacter koreensis TaxID=332977 RepID=A0A1H7ISS1_9SPHI|nr:HD domain-containing protein [Parapedobacter koreensis]SEK64757.1 HD domain-containing protein [Parapedobacter koreensis]